MLSLRYWDDPVLSEVCQPVHELEFGSQQLRDLGQTMVGVMNSYDGFGLAAPQVGLATRMFVMHFPESKRTKEPLVVCNPTLQLHGDNVLMREGCLSLPDIFEQVTRQRFATMHYFQPDGLEREIELSELDARVAQHETDHLNGIMFFDRSHMSKQVRKAVLRKWDKIKSNYPREHGKA